MKLKSLLKQRIKEHLMENHFDDDVIIITFEEQMDSNEFHPLLHKALGPDGIKKLESQQNRLSDIREEAADYGRYLPQRYLNALNSLQNRLIKALNKVGINAKWAEGDDVTIEILVEP